MSDELLARIAATLDRISEQLEGVPARRSLLTAEQLISADWLNVSKDWWAHNKRALIADRGFPPPLPGLDKHGRWDPVAVNAWLDAHVPVALRDIGASEQQIERRVSLNIVELLDDGTRRPFDPHVNRVNPLGGPGKLTYVDR